MNNLHRGIAPYLLRRYAEGGPVEEEVSPQDPQAQNNYSQLLYEVTADLTPGLGEARSAQRSGEAFDKAKQAFAAGDYLSALGFGSLSAAEGLGALPIIGMAARMPASLARMSPRVVNLFEDITAQKAGIREQIAGLGDPEDLRGEAKKQLQALQQQEQDLAIRSVYARGKAEEGVPEDEIVKILEEGAPGWDFGAKASRATVQPTLQTDTKEFKNWFGKSAVVEESGQPMVLFRGERKDFGPESAGLTWRATPSYTPNKDVANVYTGSKEGSYVTPTYIRMENPLDLRAYGNEPANMLDMFGDAGLWGKMDDSKYPKLLRDLAEGQYKSGAEFRNVDDLDLDDMADLIENASPENMNDVLEELLGNSYIDPFALADSKAVVKEIKKVGKHDGIILRDVLSESAEAPSAYDTYRPFEQTQVKSAIGNEGTFNPTTPIITKANGGEVDAPDLMRGIAPYLMYRY